MEQVLKRRDDWIDDDEYPSDADMDAFGDDSPGDYDPRTIGYYGDRPPLLTRGRIIAAVVLLILLVVFVLLPLIRLLS